MAKKKSAVKPRQPKPAPKPKPNKPGDGGVSTQDDGPGGQHPPNPPGGTKP